MAKRQLKIMILVTMLFLFAASAPAQQQQKEPTQKFIPKNVNQLIDLIWKKGEIDYNTLRDYVFSETEVWTHDTFNYNPQSKGPHITPNFIREYIWIYKDGRFLRSLVKINGAEIAPFEKKLFEVEWIKKHPQKETIKSIFDFSYGIAYNDYLDATLVGGAEKWMGELKSESEMTKDLKKTLKHCQNQGEQRFEGNNVRTISCRSIEHDFINNAFEINIALLVLPEEQQLVEYMREYSGQNYQSGIQILKMGKTMGNVWLPQKFLYSGTHLGSKFSYSKEFHSFKKTHVETNLSFDDAGANSNPLREDVKSKTQFDMKTPVPPKEETPPSQKAR